MVGYILCALLVTAGVLALCGASLLLPGWWGARQEQNLLEGPLPRPAVAGLPDEQARAIPILYDLYRARLQPGNFGWQEGDAALVPELEQCLDHLVESGVLSREMAEAVQPALDAAAPVGEAGQPQPGGKPNGRAATVVQQFPGTAQRVCIKNQI